MGLELSQQFMNEAQAPDDGGGPSPYGQAPLPRQAPRQAPQPPPFVPRQNPPFADPRASPLGAVASAAAKAEIGLASTEAMRPNKCAGLVKAPTVTVLDGATLDLKVELPGWSGIVSIELIATAKELGTKALSAHAALKLPPAAADQLAAKLRETIKKVSPDTMASLVADCGKSTVEELVKALKLPPAAADQLAAKLRETIKKVRPDTMASLVADCGKSTVEELVKLAFNQSD